MSRLAPLSEEPVSHEDQKNLSNKTRHWKKWIKSHLSFFFHKRSDLNILLSVLGCPLFSTSSSSHPQNSTQSPLEISSSASARYIVEHFRAATRCKRLEGNVKNIFATGRVCMSMVEDPNSSNSRALAHAHKGCFVVWEMVPNKWSIELVVDGHKVVAGSDGKVAWRHTPWLGSHAAKGGVRPLRRALQCPKLWRHGLDPMSVSDVFSKAQYTGENEIHDTDCFILKLSAEVDDLADRSDSSAEMIKHVTFGYFSQKSGLLIHLEDSYLTRMQPPGSQPLYWETTMRSKIEDYREIDGVMIAHSGRTHVTITRFGNAIKKPSCLAVMRMEEEWEIDDFAFNVKGGFVRAWDRIIRNNHEFGLNMNSKEFPSHYKVPLTVHLLMNNRLPNNSPSSFLSVIFLLLNVQGIKKSISATKSQMYICSASTK
ncbi:hypothetical protein V2J09_009108 [Rumex salicifolius]